MFYKKDFELMQIALEEARKALEEGNYPIGAVLVLGNDIIAKDYNKIISENNWFSHAEMNLISSYSKAIKNYIMKNKNINIYVTHEPCLMCLGALVIHRITKIIYSCPDPHGGVSSLNNLNMKNWYRENWPTIEGGLLRKESLKLMIDFLENKKGESWKRMLSMYKELKNK